METLRQGHQRQLRDAGEGAWGAVPCAARFGGVNHNFAELAQKRTKHEYSVDTGI